MQAINIKSNTAINTLIGKSVERYVNSDVLFMDDLREIAKSKYDAASLREHYAQHFSRFMDEATASSMATMTKNVITLLRKYTVEKGCSFREAVALASEKGITNNKSGKRGRPATTVAQALEKLAEKYGKAAVKKAAAKL